MKTLAWGRAIAAACATLLGTTAAAQIASSTAIDVQQFKPGPGHADVLSLVSTRTHKQLDFNVGLWAHYSESPLVLVNPASRETVAKLVDNQLTFDLVGSLGILDWLELGIAVPVTLQTSSADAMAFGLTQPVNGFGVGDLRVTPKVRIYGKNEGFALGLAVPVVLPSGGRNSFLGAGGFGVSPKLLLEYGHSAFRVLLNAGLNLRPAQQLRSLKIGNEVSYGLGTEIPFTPGGHRLALLASVAGAVGLEQPSIESSPLELLLGLQWLAGDFLAVRLGGGPGLTRGYGSPTYRLFLALDFRKLTPDDTLVKPLAACQFGPEDFDGFQDDDGCADPDDDRDQVIDALDRCPTLAETINGFEDSDGCPDDKPPHPLPPAANTRADQDNDVVPDFKDLCPTTAEDNDGFEDGDGCPESDNDRDGIDDGRDNCPLEAETINGINDEDGCPDPGKSKVRLEADKIVILDKVFFDTGKDSIKKQSFNLLNQVAALLKANPTLKKLRVEGHTDDVGDDAMNLELSKRRAESVRKFLVAAGVDDTRLVSEGYGETRPVDTNKTAKGKENNRRVEFNIIEYHPAAQPGGEEVAP